MFTNQNFHEPELRMARSGSASLPGSLPLQEFLEQGGVVPLKLASLSLKLPAVSAGGGVEMIVEPLLRGWKPVPSLEAAVEVHLAPFRVMRRLLKLSNL